MPLFDLRMINRHVNTFIIVANETKERLDYISQQNGVENGLSRVILGSVIEGAGLFLVAWSAYLYFGWSGAEWAAVWVGIGIFPLAANIMYQLWRFDQHTRTLERQCPDSLLLYAAIPPKQSFPKKIKWLAESTFLPIRDEWTRVHRRIAKGESIPEALEGLGVGRASRPLSAVKRLLRRLYESGAPGIEAAVAMAQDMMQAQSLVEERRATMMVEKYTLLLAGGIMVPILLGVLVGVVTRLPLSLAEASGAELFTLAVQIIPIYLFEYAVLTGLFLGAQEERQGIAGIYILILLPASQLAYILGQWYVRG
ncbi:MAG: type II secretion system F family protein [Candidatus Diapherotrites archaeon]|nr:type II secretion system F family protein [Candidatus Diapherotrites archaeon]MDZ4256199.1 type II secretion system F family protein [archaeon]